MSNPIKIKKYTTFFYNDFPKRKITKISKQRISLKTYKNPLFSIKENELISFEEKSPVEIYICADSDEISDEIYNSLRNDINFVSLSYCYLILQNIKEKCIIFIFYKSGFVLLNNKKEKIYLIDSIGKKMKLNYRVNHINVTISSCFLYIEKNLIKEVFSRE